MSQSSTTTGGVSIFGLLGVAFIVLKLTNVINWSWWWVTVPLWGPFTFYILLAIGTMILAWKWG
ncbi:MAG: hypothetical protein DRQ42_03165 [Gammaproteobacteria bacterium]|nr:MAG: hypothetical protein DRQ42_03165 [Gammaproteobacteria bacterium]